SGQDPLDGGQLAVLAGDRRQVAEPGGLHGRHRSAGRPVVGGIDAGHALPAQLRDRLFHLVLGPVRAPVGRVVLRPDPQPAAVEGSTGSSTMTWASLLKAASAWDCWTAAS